MVSIIGSQVKETSWRLLLKDKMLPLSMEKLTALPLTNKRIRSNYLDKILQVEQKNIHLKKGSFLLTLVELSTTTI